MKRSTRKLIKETHVGTSDLKLYLCPRGVTRGGRSYPAYQDDDVVEFDGSVHSRGHAATLPRERKVSCSASTPAPIKPA